jgi:hypothetical protein
MTDCPAHAAVNDEAKLVVVVAITVIELPIPGLLLASETSDPVTVQLPTMFNVMLKALVPATNAALAGKLALLSIEVM